MILFDKSVLLDKNICYGTIDWNIFISKAYFVNWRKEGKIALSLINDLVSRIKIHQKMITAINNVRLWITEYDSSVYLNDAASISSNHLFM
jgi:ABC-type metal ion transport system substrate-binding protein